MDVICKQSQIMAETDWMISRNQLAVKPQNGPLHCEANMVEYPLVENQRHITGNLKYTGHSKLKKSILSTRNTLTTHL
jgi:hypothetical protein